MRFFFVALGLFLKIATISAATLFVDHQFLPDGSEVDRVFESASKEVANSIDANLVAKKARVWANQFYRGSGTKVLGTDLRVTPIPFWIVRLSTINAGLRNLCYAIVLGNGEVIEPKIFPRERGTSELELKLAPPKIEIHGEMELDFATGKGLGRWEGRGRP